MNSTKKNSKQYGLKLEVVEQGKHPKTENDDTEIARIDSEISFDPSILDSYRYDGWKSVHHDLLVISAAVVYADRRTARRVTQWCRPFHLTLPVQDLQIWQRPDLQTRLIDTLRHLTGDDWGFTFFQANSPNLNNGHQRSLPFNTNKEFVIAYSDGLDSRCVTGIFDTNDTAIRVRVSKTKERVNKKDNPFDSIPFQAKPKRTHESSFRSRGFMFACVTAIASHLSETHRIIVPESGQGVFSPALLPLHNIYADYRSHPTFFRKMESFLKALLDYEVEFEQPRLWHTKGETIADFLSKSKKNAELVTNTRSCWQRRWNVRVNGKLRQCGLCAACLLRRMSMHAAGVSEPDDTYIIADLTATRYVDSMPHNGHIRLSKTMPEHGSVGVRHFQQLVDMERQPDAIIRPHVFEIAKATGSSQQDTNNKLRRLLMQHAEEWNGFLDAQGRSSFINHWKIGGRYGQSK